MSSLMLFTVNDSKLSWILIFLLKEREINPRKKSRIQLGFEPKIFWILRHTHIHQPTLVTLWISPPALASVYNSIKFETSQNLLPVLKVVTHTALAAFRHKPLLLSTWLGVLFLVQFNNFDRTMGFHWVTHSYSSHLFLCTTLVLLHTDYAKNTALEYIN